MTTVTHTVTTPSLHIAYEQTGPDSGEPVILLHGFPYDVRQYDEVRDLLANEHRRLIVPYLRGFGPTRYRSAETFRSGEQAALGKDVIDLLDALGIEKATLVGYDWGGRGACVAAALWPERVRALVSVGGYTIKNYGEWAITPQSPEQEHQLWYQWYFQTERGRIGLEQNRNEICQLLWRMWSPSWQFDAAYFETTARSFDNPDFVPTVIQSYRQRYGRAPGDPTLEKLEEQLAKKPKIAAPTIVLHGELDRVEPASSSEGQKGHFLNFYERRLLENTGHCPPKEAPALVSRAILDILGVSAG